MTDFALRYARAAKKRAPRIAQEPRAGEGEGGGQGPPEAAGGLMDLSPAERESFEERAAMREYDGGYPRAEAEELALADVVRRRG